VSKGQNIGASIDDGGMGSQTGAVKNLKAQLAKNILFEDVQKKNYGTKKLRRPEIRFSQAQASYEATENYR